MQLYTENLYIIIWVFLALMWGGLTYVAYVKSSARNTVRNTAIMVIVGLLLIFLATATNPFREVNRTSTPINFSAPEYREVPDRIIVEPQLTDELREERLQKLRESSRMRELYEFGEVLGTQDESDDVEDESEINKQGD
jgi:hypothetical protein